MTSHESDLDAGQFESDPGSRRLPVFPGFNVPPTFADFAGIGLLAAAVLQMVSGGVQALTEGASQILVGGQVGGPPFQVPYRSISVAERLSIFSRAGANVTVALLVVFAIVAIRSYRRDGGVRAGASRAVLPVSMFLACTVILANLAVGVELVRNATGAFGGFGQTGRAVGLLQCSAPVALSIGALCGYRGVSLGQREPD